MLRSALIFLRRESKMRPQRFWQVAGAVLTVFLIVSVLVDAFTPFSGVWMILRSLLLIPLGASLFAVAYVFSLRLHRQRMREQEGWVPYRLRFSPSWRRRISLLVAAFLFVLMYGVGYHVGYTFVASLVVAVVVALFAFMRLTKEEATRESMEIPDARDIRTGQRLKAAALQREAQMKARRTRNGRSSRRAKAVADEDLYEDEDVEDADE